MTYVRFDYFSRIGSKSFSLTRLIPVFLNMDIDNPIGTCKLVEREQEYSGKTIYFGEMQLNKPIDESLFFYYLKSADSTQHFMFAGINFSEKQLRHNYAKRRPKYESLYKIVINHPLPQLKRITVSEIPANKPNKEAVVISMF